MQGMSDKIDINLGKPKPTGQNTGRHRDKGFSVSKTYK